MTDGRHSQLVAQSTALSKQQPKGFGILTPGHAPSGERAGLTAGRSLCVSTPQSGAWPARCARLAVGDQLVCAPLTWAGARHRRMAASRKPPRVR